MALELQPRLREGFVVSTRWSSAQKPLTSKSHQHWFWGTGKMNPGQAESLTPALLDFSPSCSTYSM